MGPYAVVVHVCVQYEPTPPPGAYIPGDSDGRMYGALRPLPAAKETYSHQCVPLNHVLYYLGGGGYL